MAPFPSRDPSTSAILGASSAGWTPSARASRTRIQEPSSTMSSAASPTTSSGANGIKTGIPEHRANLGPLRSHGLVSNSVFKGGNGSPTSQGGASSPQGRNSSHGSGLNGSPSSRSAASQRFGFGLGISAASTGKGSTRRASGSASSMPAPNAASQSAVSTSDIENEHESAFIAAGKIAAGSPRKSQGYRRLVQASYVSHSPFKNDSELDNGKPLDLPDNAWAKSAANAAMGNSPVRNVGDSDRPATPETTPLRTATANAGGDVDMRTPTSQRTTRSMLSPSSGNGRTDSPSSRGLLVYNRLHGPRTMSAGGTVSDSPVRSTSRQERRKTVTFDEILDVQEFDRESSFGHESMRSASSESVYSSSEAAEAEDAVSKDNEPAMWLDPAGDRGAQKIVERLMVVNGSPESEQSAFSTPELSKQIDEHLNIANSHEGDSSSADSQDEPQSPRPEDVSQDRVGDKTFNTAADQSSYQDSVYVDPESDISGGNLSAYAATHRVENLVDELLGDELLDNRKQSPVWGRGGDRAVQSEKSKASSVLTASTDVAKTGRAKPLPAAPEIGDLRLNLPDWSPLMSTMSTVGDGESKGQSASGGKLPPQPQAKISTDNAKPLPSGRPHISRDIVLQRVAREKQLQQEALDRSALPAAGAGEETQKSQAKSKRDTSNALIEEVAHPASLPCVSSIPINMASATKPVRQLTDEAQRSPLERLTAEVAAEQAQAAETNFANSRALPAAANAADVTEVATGQQTWFANSSLEEAASVDAALRPSVPPSPLVLTPAQQAEQIIARRRSKNGRTAPMTTPSGRAVKPRRSLSDSNIDAACVDADERRELAMSHEAEDARIAADAREEELIRQKHLLDSSLKLAVESGFESHLEREISRIYKDNNEKYHVNDRGTFASSSSNENISHSAQAGDVATSKKAWRKLRRPSDMNEYAKEMREIRARENPKKATGKVFVVVDSFRPTSLPVPAKPTRFYCVLDNGLHVVRTATAGLRADGASKIGQEFELIQHKNLEFSLTLMVQRDAHLHEPDPSQSSPSASSRRERSTPGFSRSVGKLFMSPKKKLALSGSTSTMDGRGPAVEPMIAFLNQEGAFGQCNVVFEEIAQDCLAKCHILEIPVHGVNDPPASSLSSGTSQMRRTDFNRNLATTRGVLRLKVFYLPPLPGLAKNLLPDNLNDCIKGMETARWHMGQPWKEGTLTQLGGDCRSWRRRPVKLQGANLVCYNEVTKKATVKIDLTKAVSIEENLNPVGRKAGTAYDDDDDLDETYHVERSFRIMFKDGERIMFFADTDAEMHDWIASLGKIVGNPDIPQPSLWAQMALELIQSTQLGAQKPASVPGRRQDADAISPAPLAATPSKRVPVPSTGAYADTENKTSRQPHVPASRSRPLSMAIPQLSAVHETSTPDGTPAKAEGPVIAAVEATATSDAPVASAASKGSEEKPLLTARPRPQSMYGMPPGPLASRQAPIPGTTGPASSGIPTAVPMRVQHSMQNGSPVRKLPIPTGTAVAAVTAATSPSKTASTPRSTRPLPPANAAPVERPVSLYVDRQHS